MRVMHQRACHFLLLVDSFELSYAIHRANTHTHTNVRICVPACRCCRRLRHLRRVIIGWLIVGLIEVKCAVYLWRTLCCAHVAYIVFFFRFALWVLLVCKLQCGSDMGHPSGICELSRSLSQCKLRYVRMNAYSSVVLFNYIILWMYAIWIR